MSKKSSEINLTRKVLTVSVAVDPKFSMGHDVFDVSHFSTGKEYRVFGAVYHKWEDNSGVECWLVEDDNGVISPRDMRKFKVVKVEE